MEGYEMGESIVISKVFTGKYLENGNLGHEIVDLLEDDQNRRYIYLAPYGDYAAGHFNNNIKKVILTKHVYVNCWEIIAVADIKTDIFKEHAKKALKEYNKNAKQKKREYKFGLKNYNSDTAKDLENARKNNIDCTWPYTIRERLCSYQQEYIKNNSIKYNGVKLDDFYLENDKGYYYDEKQKEKRLNAIYVTFEAESVKRPKEPLYIIGGSQNSNNDLSGDTFYITDDESDNGKNLPNQFFTIFVDEPEDKHNNSVYNQLNEFLNSKDYNNWDDYSINQNKTTTTFLQIARQQYNELAYSNILSYYFMKYPVFCEKLMKKLDCHPSGKYTIEREENHIDILIEDDKNIIVIENKIKSTLNDIKYEIENETEEHGKRKTVYKLDDNGNRIIESSQLGKYKSMISERMDQQNIEKKQIYCILSPNYHRFKPEEKNEIKKQGYRELKYKDIFDILNDIKNQDDIKNDSLFSDEFIPAIQIQSSRFDNALEEYCKQRYWEIVKAHK